MTPLKLKLFQFLRKITINFADLNQDQMQFQEQLKKAEKQRRNQRNQIAGMLILIFLLVWCDGNPVNEFVSSTPIGNFVEDTKQIGRNIGEELGIRPSNPGNSQNNPGNGQGNPGNGQGNPGNGQGNPGNGPDQPPAIPQDPPPDVPPPAEGCTPPEWTNKEINFEEITETSFVVTWGEAEDDVAVTKWKIVLNDDVLIILEDGSARSYRITNLQPGTQYKVKVEPGDDQNCYDDDNPEDFVTTLGLPDNPGETPDEDSDDNPNGTPTDTPNECVDGYMGFERPLVEDSYLIYNNGSLFFRLMGMKKTPEDSLGIAYIYEQGSDEVFGAIIYNTNLNIVYMTPNLTTVQSGGDSSSFGLDMTTYTYRDGTALEKGRDYSFVIYLTYVFDENIDYVVENLDNLDALDNCGFVDKHAVGPATIPSGDPFFFMPPTTLVDLNVLIPGFGDDDNGDDGEPIDNCVSPLPTEVQPSLINVYFNSEEVPEGGSINVPYFSPDQYQLAREWAFNNQLIVRVEDDCASSLTGYFGWYAVNHPNGVDDAGFTWYGTREKFGERDRCSDPEVTFNCLDSSEMNYGETTVWVGIHDVASNNEWDGSWAYLSNRAVGWEIYSDPQEKTYEVYLSNLSCVTPRLTCGENPPTVTDSQRVSTPVRILLYDRDGNGTRYDDYFTINWVTP